MKFSNNSKNILLRACFFLPFSISSNFLYSQEMGFEEYNPKSTLVVSENLVTRAKFPFIDIHSHQWNVTQETVNRLVREMDEINMGVMVNLSGRGFARSGNDEEAQAYMNAMIRRFNAIGPGRFIVFTNLSFTDFGSEGWIEKAVTDL